MQQGRQEGQRLMVEKLLKVRFGAVDEELSRIIDSLLKLPEDEPARLLLTLSREELLARFENN